ncbi:homoserine kinase [Candidatus Pelagibacter sp. IMCC9063]|uniref:ribonuclease HI n=1 Tax=Pelagibacter sp. (strain IMCC9063) TaxID=1002672 RepID=UPI0002046472|nr:ribonuclease HI [Candidatus Pelagibacter sp. IMCC9063]AEA81160.1 homoserine kinase [Candidatus Pelagibacter sp. IMCC9063]
MGKKITIYTDGACSGNPGKGGWAAVIIEDKNEKTISGSEQLTTNNRMELSAVINALREVASAELDIYTDSKYVKNGIESWIKNWKINGWMTAAKQPVKNKDLWLELDTLVSEKAIGWKWVKGHSNDHYNTIVDEAARKAIS